jgi:hypothetical protein
MKSPSKLTLKPGLEHEDIVFPLSQNSCATVIVRHAIHDEAGFNKEKLIWSCHVL